MIIEFTSSAILLASSDFVNSCESKLFATGIVDSSSEQLKCNNAIVGNKAIFFHNVWFNQKSLYWL